MNIKITTCRLSYILFSIFVASLIVFIMHGKFQTIDILTIPVFALILYLIIDFSAKRLFEKNMESFMIENFRMGEGQNRYASLSNFNNVPQLSRVSQDSSGISKLPKRKIQFGDTQSSSSGDSMVPAAWGPDGSITALNQGIQPTDYMMQLSSSDDGTTSSGKLQFGFGGDANFSDGSFSTFGFPNQGMVSNNGYSMGGIQVDVPFGEEFSFTDHNQRPLGSFVPGENLFDKMKNRKISPAKNSLVGSPLEDTNSMSKGNEALKTNIERKYEEGDDLSGNNLGYDDNYDMYNENEDSRNPININVSFNSNQPHIINEYGRDGSYRTEDSSKACGSKAPEGNQMRTPAQASIMSPSPAPVMAPAPAPSTMMAPAPAPSMPMVTPSPAPALAVPMQEEQMRRSRMKGMRKGKGKKGIMESEQMMLQDEESDNMSIEDSYNRVNEEDLVNQMAVKRRDERERRSSFDRKNRGDRRRDRQS